MTDELKYFIAGIITAIAIDERVQTLHEAEGQDVLARFKHMIDCTDTAVSFFDDNHKPEYRDIVTRMLDEMVTLPGFAEHAARNMQAFSGEAPAEESPAMPDGAETAQA